MLVAMALTAALCIGIGSYPAMLYAILPLPVHYVPYTASHVLAQLQLLVFSALAFSWLMRNGIYPPEVRSVNLDFDWVYRGLGYRAARQAQAAVSALLERGVAMRSRLHEWALNAVRRHHAPGAVLARTWPSGSSALWMMIMLLALLLSGYWV